MEIESLLNQQSTKEQQSKKVRGGARVGAGGQRLSSMRYTMSSTDIMYFLFL